MQSTRTTETVGTGGGILGRQHHRNVADPIVGTGNTAAVGTGGTVGTGTTHRGPVQATADALTGRNNVSTGGVGASNVPPAGFGGATAPVQTQAGVGPAGTGAGVGTGRTNPVKRIVSEVETVTGELTGNPSLVAKGTQRKTGVPQTTQTTTTQSTPGPGVGRY
ncbi:hypothetical protein BDY19DRAFT_998020 [Irpex rosettiformis]|uniref:Uncharacterized protein n=1 Tax=Irpex rosettiformis TaxID=378272 RepID=A0ACB8TPU6_9APHY|nr:hypothetical protein BDY19DRAFT_998020 [Irpex rosettiformis]